MSKKLASPVVRKAGKKISDAKRVRYGSGMAPAAIARTPNVATLDTKKIRFGSGMAPASLRK
ncbi:MAG TPA: hypothetical protein VD965_07915 [Burkholderiales bacterium]|nr:hypothetical protein [Burkholderiales bacterium]